MLAATARYSTPHERLALAPERGQSSEPANEAHPLAIFNRLTDNGDSNRETEQRASTLRCMPKISTTKQR